MSKNGKRFDMEKQNVIDAISEAEKKTSAEIFAVFAERSDDYRFVAYSFLAFWIFIVSGLLALWLVWQDIEPLKADWSQNWSNGQFGFISFTSGQIVAFLSGVFLIRLFPQLAVMITPQSITDARAHNNAVKQYLAHGIDRTTGRTGILVFVSLEERYGEILVDAAIEGKLGRQYLIKKVGKLVENCAKGDICEGYVTVISELAEDLADGFPVTANDKNELDDRLVVL